jgi:hypothetical protein
VEQEVERLLSEDALATEVQYGKIISHLCAVQHN